MKADIDIDLPDRQLLLDLIPHTIARLDSSGRSHNSGIYITDIPRDPIHKVAAIDYEDAEKRGYFKIDLLNMSVYQLVKNPEHYEKMLAKEPNWSRLWTDPEWAQKIVHIGNYRLLLNSMKPDSIVRMAAFISVIRPGKSHLQNKPWADVFDKVWDNDDSQGYTFKKSHSIGYAMLVALHMNLLQNS